MSSRRIRLATGRVRNFTVRDRVDRMPRNGRRNSQFRRWLSALRFGAVRSLRFSLLARRLAFVALVALGFGLFLSPSPARASCGSYVLVNGMAVPSAGEHTPDLPPHRLPCNGPQCRQSPPMLPTAPPQHSPSQRDPLLWIAQANGDCDNDICRWGIENVPAPTSIYLTDIFRPPRAI
jgi:hypothetical protein